MKAIALKSISPIDGRYFNKLCELQDIFSEFGFFKFRLQIEICWLVKLASCVDIREINAFKDDEINYLNSIFINFDINDALRIKNIESDINHDVKAIEYFLKEKIMFSTISKKVIEFVHFACTSEDINNLAYALMILTTRRDILLPIWKKIILFIKKLSIDYQNTPLLSRTHGQPASPSTFGKEMANFVYRLNRQYLQLNNIDILGKINGATGNYNAHIVAYPDIDWHKISEEFVTSFGISWNPYTTQIEPHDYLAELFNCILRFNTILIDFVRDVWGYIALDYLVQDIKIGEIGSSTMPHKINPIHFENAEGNLGLSNAILVFFSTKLPISRWQRDLSDSTVLRNIGVCMGHSIIAYKYILQGIEGIKVNQEKLLSELDCNWHVLSEPIQTVLRRNFVCQPYEMLKTLTRGKFIDIKLIREFINSLPLPEAEKVKLQMLTPANYIGYASQLVRKLND